MLTAALMSVTLGLAVNDAELVERMALEHAGERPDRGAFAELAPTQPVTSTEVIYHRKGEQPIAGYLAQPVAGMDNQPAVIVIHEWWGLNDNIRHMADLLAGQGYSALAVDLYHGRNATSAEDARTLMTTAMENRADLQANLQSAYDYLTGPVGAGDVGVIGWCFGGGWSLETALLIPAIDAAVVYYGRVPGDPQALEPLQAPVLGLFGSEDQGISVESVEAFETALAEAGKNGKIVVYEGANHAFANPSGSRYHADAARDAWNRTVAFLDEHLGAP